MREHPILFSGPMVCALLGGSKTQTRRPVKQVPHWDHRGKDIMEWDLSDCYTDDDGRHWLDIQTDVDDNSHEEISCPYGQPGDRLWVREPGRVVAARGLHDEWLVQVGYLADNSVSDFITMPARLLLNDYLPRWATHLRGIPNGIFREAARVLLEIVNVRVERVQEISGADAKAEGVDSLVHPYAEYYERAQRDAYRRLWDTLYAKRGHGWDANPWVWVIEFKRTEASA